jgi:hypothetical protein
MQESQSPHIFNNNIFLLIYVLLYFTTTWLIYSFYISICSLLLKLHKLLKKLKKFLLSQSYVQEIVKWKLVKRIFKIYKFEYF